MADEQSTKSGKPSDVWTRLASAMVLVPIALTCVWYGGWLLSGFAALCAGLMAFEWARMAKSRVGVLMIAGAVAANLLHPIDPRWALIGLVGAGVIAMALEQRDGLKSTALLGTLYAGGLPLALQVLRAIPDNQTGLYIAMGVMVLSWSSDTSAYFVGRQFGGPLLAPKDSPNKTWSGALGAVAGSIITGVAFAYFVKGPVLVWAIVGACVSVAAQFGDLFESQVKRRHGVKDTSGFLPGHGGVMDRLDGFGTACVAMVAVMKALPLLAAMLIGHP